MKESTKTMIVIFSLFAINLVLYIVKNLFVHVQDWRVSISTVQLLISTVQTLLLVILMKKNIRNETGRTKTEKARKQENTDSEQRYNA